MFGVLCTATAVFCVALAGTLLIAPSSYTALYGMPADAGTLFLGRRSAPLLLGLAVFFWTMRQVGPGPLQDATIWAAVISFGGIAVTGIMTFAGGGAGLAVLVAAGIELAVALAFVLSR